MTVSRAISSLFLFRSKIEEAVNLVPGMSAEEKLKAVQFWNMVSEKLQDIVNNSAADINAIALNMSEQETEKSNLDLNNSNCMIPQNPVPAADFINMSSNYTVYTETNATFHAAGMANSQLKQFISHTSSFSSSKEPSHDSDLSDLPHIHHLSTVRYSDISESNHNDELLSTENIPVDNCDKFSKDIQPSSSAHLLGVKNDNHRVNEMYHSPRRKSSRLQPSRKIKTKTAETSDNFDANCSSPTVIINNKTSTKFEEISLSKEPMSQNCDVIDFKTMGDSSEDIEASAPVEDLDVSNEASFENIVSFVVSNSEEIIEQNQEEQFDKITKENNAEEKNSLICKICSESFPDDDSLASHYLRLHERPYCCLECKAKFTTKGNLIVHMRRHTGEKPFCCNKCPANFTTKGNLKRHIKTHSGEKPWECNRCGSCFTEKKSLTVHMRRHTGERPYLCKVCGKSFSQTSILQGHMAMHLGLKMHLCEKCGKSFRQKSQLRTHRLRHDNIRSFKCQTCSATFLTKGDLLRHQRTHTGQKPFSCDVCLKTFTRQQSLNEHTNRHYGLKPYKCKYCSKAFAEMSACYKHTKYHEKTEETDKFKQNDLETVQQTSHPVNNHFPDANGVENKEPSFTDAPSYIAVVLDSKDTNQSEYDERNQAVSFFNSGLEETNIVPNGVGVLTTINILTNTSTLPQSLQTIS